MIDQRLVFGISWFQPDQWERLIDISEDRDQLDDTYEDWRRNTSNTIKELESQGQKIKKVKINLEQLIYWCNENNLPINGKSRSQYVTYLLQQRSYKP
ncbi:MAG: hypothetical protein ACRBCS_02180 [Cellvibrionaceae bacterium]